MHRQRRGFAAHHAAAVLGQSDLRTFDLTFAGLTAQLPENLSELRHTGGTHWMPLRQQPTTGIHRGTAAQSGDAFINQAATLTVLTQTQLFVNDQLSRGGSIVDFSDVQVFWPDASHF